MTPGVVMAMYSYIMYFPGFGEIGCHMPWVLKNGLNVPQKDLKSAKDYSYMYRGRTLLKQWETNAAGKELGLSRGKQLKLSSFQIPL